MKKKQMVENIEVHHKYARVQGAMIHYIETGKGPTILLVHSWNNDWFGFMPLLKELKGFHVVALDLPGYGDSSDGFARYSVDIMADIVSGFITALKIHPKVVCGLSMGAGVVLDFGARHSNQTDLIIAMAAPIMKTEWIGSKIYAVLMRTANMHTITQRVAKKIVSNYYYGHFTARFFNLHNYSKELVDTYGLNGRSKNNPKTLFNMSVSMTKFRAIEALSQARIPTHLIFGKYDKLVDIKKARLIAKKNKNITIDLIDDAGHVITLEKPRETADSIHLFAKKFV